MKMKGSMYKIKHYCGISELDKHIQTITDIGKVVYIWIKDFHFRKYSY